ncbi:tetratricopeptide (TPR) repeat protein [Povalibacter uvarum]|uniref:Tetratricopeptide (TPR) repeat protein n=1 Tax=Povalibacter uvarum TaxID=732238 RepID=A0A841HKT0_9GAMM|nr:tetratricopeptide repeat protein [Povalibacter uvarum]MBB6092900.1 tetratricopeptide (TPR) repeat protein [Povalibacter uvarum]
MERDPSFARELLLHAELSETLQTIEIVVWLIFALLLISRVLAYMDARKKQAEKENTGVEWGTQVERAYDRGRYQEALEILATSELVYPGSALIKFWQGRCHFRLEAWEKAAEKFQESCRLEPYYRKSVKDYMAFIELNELVPGVEGYLDK